jgi:hypothetical protein
LTLWAAGATQNTVSNDNWVAGWTRANRAIVPLSTSGQISVFNQFGSVDVILDVDGYFTGPTASGSLFTSVSPIRLTDHQALGPNGTFNLSIGGVAGVPANASAAVLDAVVSETTAPSFLTVYPTGATAGTSDINWAAGQVNPNLAVTTLGTSGQATFFNSAGNVNVSVDLEGYFGGVAGPAAFQSASANQNSVTVIFNQTMNNATTGNGAANPLNYSVTSPTGGAAHAVTGATYSNADNSVTLTLATALAPGNTFTVTVPASHQIDNAGATSSVAAGTSISGTVAIATPTITYPTAGETLNTNANNGGRPQYKGTYVDNTATINISVDGTAIATTAPAAGLWTFTQPTALATGSHTLSVTATESGTTSAAASVTFSISNTTTTAPVITSPITGATNQSTLPTITGTGTAGATVNVIFDASGVPTQATAGSDAVAATNLSNGTTAVASGGTWSYATTKPLTAGVLHTVQAFQINNNFVGPGSNTVSFTTAAAPATAPTINATTSSAGSNTASIVFTDANEVAQSVTTYNVYRADGAGALFGTATKIGSVSATGATSYTFVDSTATNGTSYTYFVTAANAFASESGPSIGVTPKSTVGPIVSAVTITPNPVHGAGAAVNYSATVAVGATVDPANITNFCAVVAHIIDSNGVEINSWCLAPTSNVNTAGYGTWDTNSFGAAFSDAVGSYTDNTVATDNSGIAGHATAPFTVGAAPAVTTITVTASPTSVNSGQLSNITATVMDQYGATMAGQSVVFTVKPATSTPNGAGGTVAPSPVVTGSGGQASSVYTAGSPAQANSDTITATIGTVKGTATVAVTPTPAPAAGAPFVIGASTTDATHVTLTYNMLVVLTGTAAQQTAAFAIGACHPSVVALSAGTSSNSVVLTFAPSLNGCGVGPLFTTGNAAGNLHYSGAVVQSTAGTPVAAYSPQDVWVSSGF